MRITRVITVVIETVETLVIWRAATGKQDVTPNVAAELMDKSVDLRGADSERAEKGRC